MKLYILASLIIFCLVTVRAVKKSEKKARQEENTFWEREARANEVRKKSLENLDYVMIPGKILTILSSRPEEPFCEYHATVSALCESKIVNLSGFTNTDLKLEYGTANLTPLSQYDQNYSTLISTLHRAAESFLSVSDIDSATQLWEYAVLIHTDITGTYTGLAKLYLESGRKEELERLIVSATLLDSPNKSVIVRKLEAFE